MFVINHTRGGPESLMLQTYTNYHNKR